MESQLHRTHGHHDEADTVNDSAVVRSGLAEPTVMGTPVLAEDLYTANVNPPVRSWEDDERYGPPPPLSTNYETHYTDLPYGGHHTYGGDVNRVQLKGSFGNPAGLVDEERYGGRYTTSGGDVNREHLKGNIGNPTGGVYETHPGGRHVYADEHLNTEVPKLQSEKEVGITGVLHSFEKMKFYNEPESDPNEVYTGTHEQFAPEPASNPPLDTIAANPSNPNSSYSQRISSATSAIADKAAAVKDSIVSKLSPSGVNESPKSSFPTAFSHKVADTLSSTLGPVYEKVAGAGSSPDGKGVTTVKEYLVDKLTPGDEDKELSEAITHAFHRGKGNPQQQQQESTTTTTTTTTYVVRKENEGERKMQDSGN